MEDITMCKIFQYIMLAVVTIVMASCTSDIEETTAATGKSNVQLVVGELTMPEFTSHFFVYTY